MTIYVHIRGYITVTNMPYDISNALTIAKVKDKLVESGVIEDEKRNMIRFIHAGKDLEDDDEIVVDDDDDIYLICRLKLKSHQALEKLIIDGRPKIIHIVLGVTYGTYMNLVDEGALDVIYEAMPDFLLKFRETNRMVTHIVCINMSKDNTELLKLLDTYHKDCNYEVIEEQFYLNSGIVKCIQSLLEMNAYVIFSDFIKYTAKMGTDGGPICHSDIDLNMFNNLILRYNNLIVLNGLGTFGGHLPSVQRGYKVLPSRAVVWKTDTSDTKDEWLKMCRENNEGQFTKNFKDYATRFKIIKLWDKQPFCFLKEDDYCVINMDQLLGGGKHRKKNLKRRSRRRKYKRTRRIKRKKRIKRTKRTSQI